MKKNGKFERITLILLLFSVVYLVWNNQKLRVRLRDSSTAAVNAQRPVATQVAMVSQTDAVSPSDNREHLELLRLRGQVAQLSRELHNRAVVPNASNESATAPPPTSEPDTPLFTAATTNTVPLGSFLIIGGWSAGELRTYLLLRPTSVTDPASAEARFSITSYVVRAPESVWAELGWPDASSETRRSKLAGTLSTPETEALLAALKQNGRSTTSTSRPSEVNSGGHIGFGFSVEDDDTVGVLMAVDVYPRVIPGQEAVELGITPGRVSDKVPIHKSLKRLAVNENGLRQ